MNFQNTTIHCRSLSTFLYLFLLFNILFCPSLPFFSHSIFFGYRSLSVPLVLHMSIFCLLLSFLLWSLQYIRYFFLCPFYIWGGIKINLNFLTSNSWPGEDWHQNKVCRLAEDGEKLQNKFSLTPTAPLGDSQSLPPLTTTAMTDAHNIIVGPARIAISQQETKH